MRTESVERRVLWVAELSKLSGSFGDDTSKLLSELRSDLVGDPAEALLDHIRFCGAIPEHYRHDSSEEKLYSKYTDAVVSEAFSAMGLKSAVIESRGDAADVQAHAQHYSLVADAKAFRLSRTAKNQKDFKVQAMDGWRTGLDYAIVVCPIYQMPTRTSQIYQQAISRNVCILSYSHLAALVGVAVQGSSTGAESALHQVLKCVSTLHPSKDASDYWRSLNGTLLDALGSDGALWTAEKVASLEALEAVREESLVVLRLERDRLLGLSHKQAVEELVRMAGLDSRIHQVERVVHGPLLES